MLKLAMIAPVCLINEASKYSDCAMWLTHLFDNPLYVKAINEREVKQPSYLDNSFFELGKAAPLEDMKTAAGKLNEPVRYILPDGDFTDFESVSSMVIPTSQDELWIALRMLEKDINAFKIGISCIHAKKAMNQGSFAADTRKRFLDSVLCDFHNETAEEFKKNECFHFLGLNNQPWDELKLLSKEYNASLDSSAFTWPVVRTHGSKTIFNIQDKYAEPVDFKVDLSIYTKSLAIQHMRKIKTELESFLI